MLSRAAAQGSTSLDLDGFLAMEIDARPRATRPTAEAAMQASLGTGTVLEESAKLNQLVNGRNA
jgi:hypothetical protein